jgi:hypothetical protein
MTEMEYDIDRHVKKFHEYLEVMQSWNEMKPVADEFIHLVIDHDEIYGVDKKKKRASSLVAAQTPKPQI